MNLKPGNAKAALAQVPTKYSRTSVEALAIRSKHMTRKAIAWYLAALESLRTEKRDVRCHEAFFWVTLYNAALLEDNSEQLRSKVQLALRAVEARSATIENTGASKQERNLLQYAAIVLKRLARTAQHDRTRTRPLQTQQAP